MTQTELFKQIKERLMALYGERFLGLVLYGSTARGDARPDSDIDMLCLLDTLKGDELWDITSVLYPLQLEVPENELSVYPVLKETYDAAEYSLYREVHNEGIFI